MNTKENESPANARFFSLLLEISTCSPKFSQKVVIDDAFTAKIDGLQVLDR